MKTINLVLLPILFFNLSIIAQEESIDPSKPTNIYTRINNNFELTDRSGNLEYGYRFNYNYASSNIQFSAEVPFLYSNVTNYFGLSDIRLRSFYVPYIDYDRTIGALGMSLDLFIPTGNEEQQLGSGSWSISPGIITGIMINNNYSIWPTVSYRYQFRSNKKGFDEQHGMTLQILNSINISEKVYLMATPMFLMNDFINENKDLIGAELEFNYMIKPNKIQIGFFTRQLKNRTDRIQSYRIMARFFL